MLIILGGMGPMAGVRLHELIVQLDAAATCDQEHVDVLHLALASWIPDRSEFLITGGPTNPGTAAADLLQPLLHLVETQGRDYRVLIPCATFHAAPILDPFLSACGDQRRNKIVSLITPAVKRSMQCSRSGRVGILATAGSTLARVWQAAILRAGGTPVSVDTKVQASLQEAIFNPSFGLKSVSPPSQESVSLINLAIAHLSGQGVDSVILGCTDIALIADALEPAALRYIDPLVELAKHTLADFYSLRRHPPDRWLGCNTSQAGA